MFGEKFEEMTFLVFNEIPNALRHAFKTMWYDKYRVPWVDSAAERSQLHGQEGYTTKIPATESYMNWEATTLFRATIFASTFKNAAGKKMSDLVPNVVRFHASVISPTKNKNETFALAIDQLRLIRNMYCHSSNVEIIKSNYDDCMVEAKKAFAAINYRTTFLKKKSLFCRIPVWFYILCIFGVFLYVTSAHERPTSGKDCNHEYLSVIFVYTWNEGYSRKYYTSYLDCLVKRLHLYHVPIIFFSQCHAMRTLRLLSSQAFFIRKSLNISKFYSSSD